jgi:hypothetical protein
MWELTVAGTAAGKSRGRDSSCRGVINAAAQSEAVGI